MSLRRMERVLIAAAVAVALLTVVVVAMVLATPAGARTGCDSRACQERVAMKQCSQSRPVACVQRAALRHRVNFGLQLAIARCESGLDPAELNDGGSGASGLMQFMPGTFAGTPYRWHWIFSAKWNALAGAWLLKRAGTGPWTASRGCWG